MQSFSLSWLDYILFLHLFQLRNIADKPSEDHVFVARNYDALNNIIDSVRFNAFLPCFQSIFYWYFLLKIFSDHHKILYWSHFNKAVKSMRWRWVCEPFTSGNLWVEAFLYIDGVCHHESSYFQKVSRSHFMEMGLQKRIISPKFVVISNLVIKTKVCWLLTVQRSNTAFKLTSLP